MTDPMGRIRKRIDSQRFVAHIASGQRGPMDVSCNGPTADRRLRLLKKQRGSSIDRSISHGILRFETVIYLLRLPPTFFAAPSNRLPGRIRTLAFAGRRSARLSLRFFFQSRLGRLRTEPWANRSHGPTWSQRNQSLRRAQTEIGKMFRGICLLHHRPRVRACVPAQWRLGGNHRSGRGSRRAGGKLGISQDALRVGLAAPPPSSARTT